MPDLPESCEVAHRIHHIVRRFSFRLVDDERAVKRRRLWLAWHLLEFSVPSVKTEKQKAKLRTEN
jgi:hypothetical protein